MSRKSVKADLSRGLILRILIPNNIILVFQFLEYHLIKLRSPALGQYSMCDLLGHTRGIQRLCLVGLMEKNCLLHTKWARQCIVPFWRQFQSSLNFPLGTEITALVSHVWSLVFSWLCSMDINDWAKEVYFVSYLCCYSKLIVTLIGYLNTQHLDTYILPFHF